MDSHKNSKDTDHLNELRDLLNKATILSTKFRYSQALGVLTRLIDKTCMQDDEIQLYRTARELKLEIEKKRTVFQFRLVIILLFVLSIGIVSILQYLEISSTEIIAQIETGGIYMELAQDSSLESELIESVILSGVNQVDTYAISALILNVEDANSNPVSAVKKRIDLDPYSPLIIRSGETSGSLRISGPDLGLQSLELYKNVPIVMEVSTSVDSSTVTIRQTSHKALGVLNTGSETYIECAGYELCQGKAEPVAVESLHILQNMYELQFSNQSTPVDVALAFGADEMKRENAIRRLLHLNTVDFTTSYLGNPTSFIKSGVVTFTELNDEEITLSEDEFLILEDLNKCSITHLTLGNPIKLRLQGRVGKIRSGSGSILHSRMPTLLEWIWKSESISLFVAAISAIFTFLLAALLRLQLGPKE